MKWSKEPNYKLREKWIYEQASKFFENQQFKFVKRVNQYRKNISNGFQCVIFSITHYPDTSIFEAHLGIRLDSVEQLAFPYTNGLPGFRKDSMTLVTPIAKLKGKLSERYNINSESSAKEAIMQVETFMNNNGFQFLEQYSKVNEMEQLYNHVTRERLHLIHNQLHRCFRGITLAKLVRRSDLIHLIQAYRMRLIDLGGARVLKKFDRLAKFLWGYSPN